MSTYTHEIVVLMPGHHIIIPWVGNDYSNWVETLRSIKSDAESLTWETSQGRCFIWKPRSILAFYIRRISDTEEQKEAARLDAMKRMLVQAQQEAEGKQDWKSEE